MKTTIAILLSTLLAACSSDPAATCDTVDVDGRDYCVYRNAITETGYICPDEMPNMFRDDDLDLVACSSDTERPPFDQIAAAQNDGLHDDNSNIGNAGTPDMGGTNNVAFADFGLPPGDFDGGAAPDFSGSACEPGMPEVCDGIDNNCDGQIDEPVACDNAFDCPDQAPYIVSCVNQLCEYKAPLQLTPACMDPIPCEAGELVAPPAECF